LFLLEFALVADKTAFSESITKWMSFGDDGAMFGAISGGGAWACLAECATDAVGGGTAGGVSTWEGTWAEGTDTAGGWWIAGAADGTVGTRGALFLGDVGGGVCEGAGG